MSERRTDSERQRRTPTQNAAKRNAKRTNKRTNERTNERRTNERTNERQRGNDFRLTVTHSQSLTHSLYGYLSTFDISQYVRITLPLKLLSLICRYTHACSSCTHSLTVNGHPHSLTYSLTHCRTVPTFTPEMFVLSTTLTY